MFGTLFLDVSCVSSKRDIEINCKFVRQNKDRKWSTYMSGTNFSTCFLLFLRNKEISLKFLIQKIENVLLTCLANFF